MSLHTQILCKKSHTLQSDYTVKTRPWTMRWQCQLKDQEQTTMQTLIMDLNPALSQTRMKSFLTLPKSLVYSVSEKVNKTHLLVIATNIKVILFITEIWLQKVEKCGTTV